MGVISVIA
jgi:hypothetical protein